MTENLPHNHLFAQLQHFLWEQGTRHDFPLYENFALSEPAQHEFIYRLTKLGVKDLKSMQHGYSSLVFDIGNEVIKLMPISHAKPECTIIDQIPALIDYVVCPTHSEIMNFSQNFDSAVGNEPVVIRNYPKVMPLEIEDFNDPRYLALRWELNKHGVNVPDLISNIGLLLDKEGKPIKALGRDGREYEIPVVLDAGAIEILDPVLEREWIKSIKRQTPRSLQDLEIWSGVMQRCYNGQLMNPEKDPVRSWENRVVNTEVGILQI